MKTLIKIFGIGCINCGRTFRSKRQVLCSACEAEMKRDPPMRSSMIISAVTFSNMPARNVVYYMKKHYDAYIFDYAAKLIAKRIAEYKDPEEIKDYYITYAPRNPITFLKKRYDQSKEIADFLSIRLFDREDRVVSLFKRYPFTDEQKKLSSVRRKANASNMFALRVNKIIPEKVIIVDDVATTGSTLFALRDILLDAGVKDIILCSFATKDERPTMG